MFYRSLFATLLLAVFSGCAGSGAMVEAPTGWDEGALRAHLRQLTEPVAVVDSARAARRTLYAVRRMEAAGLMPARDPSFLFTIGGTGLLPERALRPDPARAHVLGYVTGRHPSHYDKLVLVAADLDRPGAAAVLEVARKLAEQARDTQIPERTVLFALWAPSRRGALGLRDYLANPTWGLDAVARVLLVTADTTAVSESRRLLEARGIESEVVAVNTESPNGLEAQPAVAEAFALANTTVLAEVLAGRLRSAVTVEDSTAVGLVEIN